MSKQKNELMRKALLIVDVQECWLNEETSDVVVKIDNFLHCKHAEFDAVWFFRFMNEKHSNWVKLIGWNGGMSEAQTKLATILEKYVTSDNVFKKKAAFSIFRVREFVVRLKKENIGELVICGFDTHACVYVSVMEAFERGYKVKVVKDLCAAFHGKEYHEAAIKALERNLGKKVVVTSAEI